MPGRPRLGPCPRLRRRRLGTGPTAVLQVYCILKDADPTQLTSVSIWCDRFDMSFDAAELVPTG